MLSEKGGYLYIQKDWHTAQMIQLANKQPFDTGLLFLSKWNPEKQRLSAPNVNWENGWH